MAVGTTHLLQLGSSARESLGLGDHMGSPFLRVLLEHKAEALVTVVACAAPTAPHSAAQLDSNPLTFLPAPAHGGVNHLADRGDAPMVPVVSRNVSGPQEGLSVPGVNIKTKGLFDGFVVVVIVGAVCVGTERWSNHTASNC